MDDVDFLLKKHYWTKTNLKKIFSHLSPTEFAQLIELSDSCADVGTLKTKPWVGFGDYEYFPIDFISWLIEVEKSWIPQKVLDWYAEQPKPEPTVTPPYLDSNHPLHSPELKIAIEAWQAVLQDNPNRPKVRSRKVLIENWLKENHSKLKQSEIDRITVMINPDKSH
jgi:hypothetical protein